MSDALHIDPSDNQLADKLEQLIVTTVSGAGDASNHTPPLPPQPPPPLQPLLLLCDLSYGFPKEARPRHEKIRAMARQLVNFLQWQHRALSKHDLFHATIVHQEMSNPCNNDNKNDDNNNDDTNTIDPNSFRLQPAQVIIVGSNDAPSEQALNERIHELWNKENPHDAFPTTRLHFASQSLEDLIRTEHGTACEAAVGGDSDGDGGDGESAEDKATNDPHQQIVYLSPDAPEALDPHQPPPRIAIVGLVIDRRTIQVNRSLQRAQSLCQQNNIPPVAIRRWPLEAVAASHVHVNEPLNVDCILEGMQQWYWNYLQHHDTPASSQGKRRRTCFERAAIQALQHHQERHPERPLHKTIHDTT